MTGSSTGGPGLGKHNDPNQHVGFVEFKLKHGAARADIIRQLEAKGLDPRSAAALVDRTRARVTAIETKSRAGTMALARVFIAGALAGAGWIALWTALVLSMGTRMGYMAAGEGVAVGLAVLLAAWGSKGASLQIAAVLITAVALVVGEYALVDPYGLCITGGISIFSPPPLSSFPLDCLKQELIGGYEAGWVVFSLAAAWWLAGREWIRPR